MIKTRVNKPYPLLLDKTWVEYTAYFRPKKTAKKPYALTAAQTQKPTLGSPPVLSILQWQK